MSPADRPLLSLVGNTPLVPLARIGRGLPVPLYGKCEHLNPGGSVKDRIAVSIVDDAEARGLIEPGATLVEATAGNTGMGLALVAAARGYRLSCVMPEKMSVDKRVTLELLGARVIITPNAPPDSPDNFQNVARRLAAENGWFLTDQFKNPANVRAHESGTGPEIFEQCGGRVGAFVAGAGTGGTITGVGRLLKARSPSGKAPLIVLADPIGSRLAHIVDRRQFVEMVGLHDIAHRAGGAAGQRPLQHAQPFGDRRTGANRHGRFRYGSAIVDRQARRRHGDGNHEITSRAELVEGRAAAERGFWQPDRRDQLAGRQRGLPVAANEGLQRFDPVAGGRGDLDLGIQDE